jgi:hypothetical protein
MHWKRDGGWKIIPSQYKIKSGGGLAHSRVNDLIAVSTSDVHFGLGQRVWLLSLEH